MYIIEMTSMKTLKLRNYSSTPRACERQVFKNPTPQKGIHT